MHIGNIYKYLPYILIITMFVLMNIVHINIYLYSIYAIHYIYRYVYTYVFVCIYKYYIYIDSNTYTGLKSTLEIDKRV